LLILANKQDIKGALAPEEIAKVRLLAEKQVLLVHVV
jgi:signal recognition particle receptor subunit beta